MLYSRLVSHASLPSPTARLAGQAAPWWSPVAAKLTGLRAHALAPADVIKAQRLLYEVYVEEQGWEPLHPNAWGHRANHAERLLQDVLDDAVLWLGVTTRSGALVACARLIARNMVGRFEVEPYVDVPPELMPGTVETNRVAVAKTHRASLALPLLYGTAEWAARKLGAVRTIGSLSQAMLSGPAGAYGWRSTGIEFRYHPDDPAPCYLSSCDFDQINRWLVVRLLLGKRLRRRQRGR